MKKDFYLLEKKELIVLVLLLTLVSLISFTIGIKMGKNLRDAEIKIAEDHKPVAMNALEGEGNEHHDGSGASVNAEAVLEDKLIKAVEGEKMIPAKELQENAAKHEKIQSDLPDDKSKTTHGEKALKESKEHTKVEKNHETKATLHEKVAPHGKDVAHGKAPLQKEFAKEVKIDNKVLHDAGTMFTVQVGAHQGLQEANEQVAELKAKGLDAFAFEVKLRGKGVWYRVGVGKFHSQTDAKDFAKTKPEIKSYIIQKME